MRTIMKTIPVTALMIGLLGAMPAQANLLFDDFNGNSLDQSTWRLPTGPGTFFGRTQIKPPGFFQGVDYTPKVSNGTVILQLDTHNRSDPNNNSFWGHEIQSFQTFLPGDDGLSIKSRMRFLGSPPGGLVGGFFTWGLDGGTMIRDEIDFELLTNNLSGDFLFTNVYNNTDFSQNGVGGLLNIPGYDMTDWNTYEIRWLPESIEWLVNDQLVRTYNGVVDGNPSEVRINLWAPNEGFRDAYNFFLQPANAANNQTYQLEIDYVSVSQVPLPASVWLFFSGMAALIGFARRKHNI